MRGISRNVKYGRVRCVVWEEGQRGSTRLALLTGCSRKGPWRMSKVKWVVIAMPNAYFDSLGLFLPGPRSA
jgi:RNA-directed DNA polymerase